MRAYLLSSNLLKAMGLGGGGDHGVTSAIGCILFSRGGLPSASLFAAVLAARHFWAG